MNVFLSVEWVACSILMVFSLYRLHRAIAAAAKPLGDEKHLAKEIILGTAAGAAVEFSAAPPPAPRKAIRIAATVGSVRKEKIVTRPTSIDWLALANVTSMAANAKWESLHQYAKDAIR